MVLLLLVLLVVIGAVLAVVGIVGFGPFATERRRDRAAERAGCGWFVLAVPAVVLVMLVALLGAVGGLRGGGQEHDAAVGGDDVSERTTTPAAPRVVTGLVESEVLGPVVRVVGEAGAVGGLRSDTVLRVQVEDLPSFARVRVMQCAGAGCGNVVLVQLDEAGTAAFEYLVTDRFAPEAERGRCRLEATACSLVVEEIDGDARASALTLFVDELPEPGDVTLDPARGLRPRHEVAVRLSGFVPSAAVELVVCAGPSRPDRCSEVGETVLGRDGRGTAAITVPAEVGRDRVSCERSGCFLHVRSSSSFARAPATLLRYALPEPVDYEGRRLLAGLAVAVLLLGLGTFFVLRTDWSPIGEAAAPEIDEAEYADLDALVAAMPPEEDFDELVARSS